MLRIERHSGPKRLDHPARPADDVLLDTIRQHRGYRKQPTLNACFSWKDIGEPSESSKPMTFWMKTL